MFVTLGDPALLLLRTFVIFVTIEGARCFNGNAGKWRQGALANKGEKIYYRVTIRRLQCCDISSDSRGARILFHVRYHFIFRVDP